MFALIHAFKSSAGSCPSCSLLALTGFLFDPAEELNDVLDRHADMLIRLLNIDTVALITVLLITSFVLEELESDVRMRQEDLLAVEVDPLLRAT